MTTPDIDAKVARLKQAFRQASHDSISTRIPLLEIEAAFEAAIRTELAATSAKPASGEVLMNYPGDEAAIKQSGLQRGYCSCVARADDDDHKQGCKFWDMVLEARKMWHDRHVVAWSCAMEAKGYKCCFQWCGRQESCPTSTVTDKSSYITPQPAQGDAKDAERLDWLALDKLNAALGVTGDASMSMLLASVRINRMTAELAAIEAATEQGKRQPPENVLVKLIADKVAEMSPSEVATFMQARAILHAAPAASQRQPLSDEQLREAARTMDDFHGDTIRIQWKSAKLFARAIEAAHGITATPQGKI